MPTAELLNPDEIAASPADSTTAAVDAMLAQADSLINEVQASLGGPSGATSTAPSTEEPLPATDVDSQTADTADSILEIAEQITASTEKTDANDVHVDAGDPVLASGPTHAPATTSPSGPEERMKESPDKDPPSIPDSHEASARTATNGGPRVLVATRHVLAATCQASRRLAWLLPCLLHLPVDILVLLDRPFARMSPRFKSCIGYLAIGTLTIASITWVYGNLHQPS